MDVDRIPLDIARSMIVTPWIYPDKELQNKICEICELKLVQKRATYRLKNSKKFVHVGCFWERATSEYTEPAP